MSVSSESYFRPDNLPQALNFLTPEVKILSGGTDFFPDHVGKTITDKILDISGIQALKEIVETENHWRIGATASWSDLIEKSLPTYFDGLKLAAREVGGVQIQNQGTLAGNICNASPAADGPPVLMTLDAAIEIKSRDDSQTMPLSDFILGNRKTCLNPGYIVSAILIPKRQNRAESHFLKLGARRYLVISIVMVSAVIEERDEKIVSAGLSVGSCSAVAQRLPELEKRLIGLGVNDFWEDHVFPGDLGALSPIDDIRADAEYRKEAALILVKRTLKETRLKFNPNH